MIEDERPASHRRDKALTVNQLLKILTATQAAYGGETSIMFGTAPIAGGVLICSPGNGYRLSLAVTCMDDITGGF